MGYTLKEAEKYDTIPEGVVLEAEVVKATEKDSFFDVDQDRPELGKQREVSFRFRITDDAEYANEEGELVSFFGRQLFGRTSTTFSNHPDCKLRIWVQEILGVDSLDVGFDLADEENDDGTKDLVTLEGLPVKVVVGHYQPKKPAADGSMKPPVAQVTDLIRIGGFGDASETF